jgi:uncharacterized protein YyaL (SSP411 family)
MKWIIFLGLMVLFPPISDSSTSPKIDNRIQQQIKSRLAAGDKANQLIDEQSPYLLQHAFNPVNWYPWGEKAFDLARLENKPIFLSIGYSTCHWCHVMARESFENKEVADLLNRWFISIKVDREERPDIDQMYMAATQKMTGGGGWPMSVFLLADGSPFYAGTYFPPDSSYNRPGFKDLLTKIHKAWQENKEEIHSVGRSMTEALEAAGKPSGDSIESDVFGLGYSLFEKSHDAQKGGFSKAPKFPRPAALSFLFSYHLRTGEEYAKQMALFTLDKMAAGGMYDQLGGGFHRYAVDENWFVPHFEKMLYDQAQLADSYLDAYQITQDEKYAGIAREIFAYILRDMRDPEGGFYSAEDADSDNPYNPGEHGEGAFYLWKKEEIDKILGQQAAELFNYTYGVKENGNVVQDQRNEFTGRNILYRLHEIKNVASTFEIKEEVVEESLLLSKAALMKVRDLRIHPHLDDKVITAWNGMMIGAMARGGMILKDPQLLEAAKKTALFIKDHLYDSVSNALNRRYRNGEAGLAGQLDDYAFLIAGLLDLYQASQDPLWLKWSMDLTQKQLELFWNETGGFFFDSVADPTLRVRMRSGYDGAEPAGNSVAALNFLRLGQLHNKPQWLNLSRRLIESFSETINRYPQAAPLMLMAWKQSTTKPTQVVIAGKREAEDTRALLDEVVKNFDPDRLILLADGSANQSYLAKELPFLQTVEPIKGKAAAYVCSNFTCRLPVTDPADLQQQLRQPTKN